jgi:hypothetical protein
MERLWFLRREGNDNEWQDNYFLIPSMYGRKLEMSSNFPCLVERVFNYIFVSFFAGGWRGLKCNAGNTSQIINSIPFL